MSSGDPYSISKTEVDRALGRLRTLYKRWQELQDENSANFSKGELDWTVNELTQGLHYIDWEVDDLEESISLCESDTIKQKVDNKEVTTRRAYHASVRDEVRSMKDRLNMAKSWSERTSRLLLDNATSNSSSSRQPSTHGNTKYSRLANEIDSPTRSFVDNTLAQQNGMFREQDDQIDMLSNSVSTLKNVSRQIGSELDEQAVMLDDLGHDIEGIDTKLDSTMKKIAKVLHLSNDRRQWIAIGVLTLALLIIVILFIVL